MDGNSLLINLKDIVFAYQNSLPTLNELNLQFYRGDKIRLMGANGSGKTTLFHVIMGLLKPASGEIEIFGNSVKQEKDFRYIRGKIGLLFQDADDQLFCPTVIEDVAFGPLNFGKSQDEALDIAHNILDLLGLKGFENRLTHRLSGGEKKLVSLATILSMQPEILLLDEPTAGLDNKTKNKLANVLSDIDASCILVSHENDFIDKITTSTCIMKNGKITF